MTRDRQNWVWIARRNVYLEKDGSDRAELDPASGPGSDESWWTCHKDTWPGDVALLYRTAPKSDIAYVFEATSRSRVLGERPSDGAISEKRFERFAQEAVADGVVARDAVDNYLSARTELFLSRNVARKRDWRFQDLDAIQADHERRGSDLVARERAEGYSDEIQAGFDAWEAEDDALFLLSETEFREEDLSDALSTIRTTVFASAGWPEDTLLPDENEFVGLSVCAWKPVYKLTDPLSGDVLRSDPWLKENWNALRANFKGSAFRFDDEVWQRVIALGIQEGNAGLRDFV